MKSDIMVTRSAMPTLEEYVEKFMAFVGKSLAD